MEVLNAEKAAKDLYRGLKEFDEVFDVLVAKRADNEWLVRWRDEEESDPQEIIFTSILKPDA